MASQTEDRITELEIRVAYLDQALAELNDAMVGQGEMLEALRQRLDRTVAGLEALLGGENRNDVPPD